MGGNLPVVYTPSSSSSSSFTSPFSSTPKLSPLDQVVAGGYGYQPPSAYSTFSLVIFIILIG